jgi:hypothetical protein
VKRMGQSASEPDRGMASARFSHSHLGGMEPLVREIPPIHSPSISIGSCSAAA